MDDENDGENFLQAGELPPLSIPAFQLHTFAIIESFQRGTPGFVSDDYLDSISAETTVSAVELETAGLWVRRDDGYFVDDDETIGMVLSFNERQADGAAECLARGHHAPLDDDEAWIICATCHVPLVRPDGKPVAGVNGEPPNYGPRQDDLRTD
ncbi:hypothetical protein [Microbacterium sp. NPDC055357]